MQRRNNVREMHVQIKSMMKQQKKKNTQIPRIKNKNGDYCGSKEEQEEVWLEYVTELYSDKARSRQIHAGMDEVAPRIEPWELDNAIKKVRNNKAMREDQIPAEVLKNITPAYKKALLTFLNRMYERENTRRL